MLVKSYGNGGGGGSARGRTTLDTLMGLGVIEAEVAHFFVAALNWARYNGNNCTCT